MEDTAEFFSYSYHSSLFAPIDIDLKDGCLNDKYLDAFVSYILDAKYEQSNIHDIVFDQHHLSLNQWQDLFNILYKYTKIISWLPWSLSTHNGSHLTQTWC